jgi:hypothetical protein
MFARRFHDLQNCTALLRHANPSFPEMGLQSTRHFGFG